MTGITARQLVDERGLAGPAREGHRRIYSLEDLTEVAMFRELRRKGFSFERMRKVVRFLQETVPAGLGETVSGSSNYHLLTDSRAFYPGTPPHEIVDLLKKFPAADVCPMRQRYRFAKARPLSAEGTPRPQSVRRKRFHAQGRNRVGGEFALRREEWLLSSKS